MIVYLINFLYDKKLEYSISKVESILQGSGIQSKRAYFREEQTLLSTLPLLENNADVQVVSKRNVLTSIKNIQTVITCTGIENLTSYLDENSKVFRVINGRIQC